MPPPKMMGQYDGDGRCTLVLLPSWATSSAVAVRTTRWFSSRPYLRCQNSSWRSTSISESKLCSGTGEAVIHSRPRASQGSGPTSGLPARRHFRVLAYTFHKNMATPMAITNAPMVATMFHRANPSSAR